MRLTKYEHACFMIEHDGASLIVDPGEFTTNFVAPDTVVAVVITHEHQDHLSSARLRDITTKNPDAIIYGHADVMAKVDGKTQAVVANEGIGIGPFKLEFFGGTHATIHSDMPPVANLGVMINDTLYYPGESFTLPGRPVAVLALPVAAPWMKVSEAIDFVRTVKPDRAFPTHDAILSDTGKGLPDRLIPALTEAMGIRYERLRQPIDI